MEFNDVQNNAESWKFVSSMIPGTTNESCLFKWLSLKRYKITQHSWSEDEEQILINLEKYIVFKLESTLNRVINGNMYLKNCTLSTKMKTKYIDIQNNVESIMLVS